MKKSLLARRGLLAGALLLAGGGALALGAAPAGASNKQATAAGSFTTYQVMHNIFGASLNDLLPGGTTAAQTIPATPEVCKGGITFHAEHHTTTHDTTVFNTILSTTGTKAGAPNGSTSGRKFLHAEEPVTTGGAGTHHGDYNLTKSDCIDFARSSAPPTRTDVSTHFDYYAYALDAVAPVVGKNAGGSKSAPIALSLKTIENIYLCKPHFQNWSTVDGAGVTSNPTKAALHLTNQGGQTAPIIRFWPQTGSGTRSVYKTMMGFTPDTTKENTPHGSNCGNGTSTSTTDRPITHFTNVTVHGLSTPQNGVPNEENTEDGIIYESSLSGKVTLGGHTTGVLKATAIKDAIFIYSAGKFSQEWGTTSNFNATDTNSITKNTVTKIGRFKATTLFLGKVLKQAGTTAPTSTVEEYLVFGAPLSGVYNATTNRGTYSINTTVVKETNEWFSHVPVATDKPATSKAAVPGVRYIYNVADTALPSYSMAKEMIGFDNVPGGTKSALCNGDDSSIINNTGFEALDAGSTAPSGTGGGYKTGGSSATSTFAPSDSAQSFCREFPGKSLPTWGGSEHWASSTFVFAT